MPTWDLSKDIDLLIRFLEIRTENGYDFPRDLNQFKIQCRKSSLLHRMLEGKEPLSIPPPKSFSYPWYDLIELGIGHPFEVWEANDSISSALANFPAVVIDQSAWKVLEKTGEDSWIVTYPYGPDNDRKFAEGKWHVYCVGNRIPYDPNPKKESTNKLWEIKRVE
jgi:hypothetical protein